MKNNNIKHREFHMQGVVPVRRSKIKYHIPAKIDCMDTCHVTRGHATNFHAMIGHAKREVHWIVRIPEIDCVRGKMIGAGKKDDRRREREHKDHCDRDCSHKGYTRDSSNRRI